MAKRNAAAPDAALTLEAIERAVREGRATRDAAAEAIARSRPVRPGFGYAMPDTPMGDAPPPPKYSSWADWSVATTEVEKRRRFHTTANRSRLLSGAPTTRVTASEVRAVLEAAQGRCFHCGSLAVEGRPSGPSGRPLPWPAVGRRIGSLGHRVPRFHGGGNEPTNLIWSCLWCNTWRTERRRGAADHGGVYPVEPGNAGRR